MYRWNWNQMWAVSLCMVITAAAAGCSGSPKKEPESVEVSVTLDGSGKTAENEKTEGFSYAGEDGQYYVPFFYPEELLEWSSDEAGDLSWCASVIPLAERVNQEKENEARVMAVSIMNSGTSGNPAQGSSEFMGRANMFSFWQYVDTLIYWGGSAGEGIIVPPGPDVTDAGHKNGVKVLGTVFFPQEVHGGRLDWVRQMTARAEDGTFLAADKLIELANTLKFDGWFINQETEGGTEDDAKAMSNMIAYMKEKAPELTVVWYDSMTEDGSINWQNALNSKNQMFMGDKEGKKGADSMFLNFWWTTDRLEKEVLLEKSEAYARQHNMDPYELYAGVDVQAEGVCTPVRWNLFLKPDGTPYTSLGLYCPSWTYYSADGDADLFQDREELLWVSGQRNPSLKMERTGQGWPGISSFKREQSVVAELPFVTDFSMGHGKAWYMDGVKTAGREWNNRSIQDIMPTYRFSLKGEIERPDGAVDYGEAWNGGSCIRYTGSMETGGTAEAELFAAGLKLEQAVRASTVMKSNIPISLSLRLEYVEGGETIVYGDQAVGKEWTRTNYDLSGLEGKTLGKISLLLKAEEKGQAVMKLGQFSLLDRTYPETRYTAQPQFGSTTVKGIYSADGIRAGARISLGERTDAVSRYEIYEKTGEGLKFVKASANPETYLDGITRQGKNNGTEFEVMTVDRWGERRSAGGFTMEWGPYPKPIANFTADKTLVKPGEAIKLTSLSSETAEEFFWELDGAAVRESREENPTVIYNQAGTYTVSLTAKNSTGENRLVKEGLIVVSDKSDQLAEVAGGKPAEVSGFTNNKEAGDFAVDGAMDTKWCAVGGEPHTITIDLGEACLISEVEIFHAQAGGEGRDYNTRDFTILAGLEHNKLKEAAVVSGNKEAVSRIPVAPVTARYVKISIDKATQGGDTAARIYEIKIYGIPGVTEIQ